MQEPSADLGVPTIVDAKVLTPHSAEVTWNKSNRATGYLISYNIATDQCGGAQTVTVNDANTTSHTLDNLLENTLYNITVYACDGDNRKSGPSTVVQIRTGKCCITIIISLHV